MRDGATGRSRGFGFLTFKDPRTVNIVMVKEHSLDGKLVRPGHPHPKKSYSNTQGQIDPKRAIPREEQERTAKIFVGGVSQDCTEAEFKDFFMHYGRVLDATLMMDKDTGRPRGFGFVTFDSDAAVDRTLEGPLAIHGKMIEVKRAQPRKDIHDNDGGHGKFGRQNKGGGFYNSNNDNQQNQVAQNGQNGNTSNMTPAMMAQYWQRMQQYFQMMRQQMMANNMNNNMNTMNNNMNGMNGMNPMQAMQQNPQMMQQIMASQGMNPAMVQQMQAQMQQGGFQGGGMPSSNSPMNGGPGGVPRAGFNAQEQLMFEQHKYERQQSARMQQGSFQGGNTWEGMYDDVPAPAGMQGRGNFNGGGRGVRGGGRGSQGHTPQPGPAGQAPANAPTGPKNAGMPGANYRGGGRGNRRGYHPYGRSGM